jgi:predicted Zn-ribbon and HTH transcriptional regulator
MCSGGGPMNLVIDELKWYKYWCEDSGKVYKNMGIRSSICPDCKSENVVKV